MTIQQMTIQGFFSHKKAILFAKNTSIFQNASAINTEHLWQMCDRNFSDLNNPDYAQVIQSVFSLYKVNTSTHAFESTEKILAFDISSSMYDCLAYQESHGFFDECDCPPPEFWMAYIDDRLFSYIPKAYIDQANAGVNISMSESLQWLEPIFA
ncbi:hypothetical protein [Acinetobacter rathckeae]|uniref:hypothetical protein n=2 Tax=Acinetobacter rathckeae TaxID=2605272 RepID=UPI0018A268A8|nr:hypothetical protein [Acinetobacter rathckeae]MBF7688937.1 hypothetical protein [Acinetobacter rathckeae]